MRLGYVPDKQRAAGRLMILGFVVCVTAFVTYQIDTFRKDRALRRIYQDILKGASEHHD